MHRSSSQSPNQLDVWDEERARRLSIEEAARALCMAVFIRALRDLLNNRCKCKKRCACTNEAKRLYREAKEWIDGIIPEFELREEEIAVEDHISQREAYVTLMILDHYWTFDNVCAILGWDASWVREQVPRLNPEDVSRLDSLW